MQGFSRKSMIGLAVVPAVASSLGTYCITRALYERPTPPPVAVSRQVAMAYPAQVVREVAAEAAPFSLNAYEYPGADKRGMSRSGDFEMREYATEDAPVAVVSYYRQRMSPNLYRPNPASMGNGAFSSGSNVNGVQVNANGRVQFNPEGDGHAVLFRRDSAGLSSVVVTRSKGGETAIVTSYAPLSQ